MATVMHVNPPILNADGEEITGAINIIYEGENIPKVHSLMRALLRENIKFNWDILPQYEPGSFKWMQFFATLDNVDTVREFCYNYMK